MGEKRQQMSVMVGELVASLITKDQIEHEEGNEAAVEYMRGIRQNYIFGSPGMDDETYIMFFDEAHRELAEFRRGLNSYGRR